MDWRKPGEAVWTSLLPARLPLHSLHAWRRGGDTVLCAASARAAYVATAGSGADAGALAWQGVPTGDALPGERPPRVAGVVPWPASALQQRGTAHCRAGVLLSLTGGEPGTMRSAAQPRLVARQAASVGTAGGGGASERASPCVLTGHGRVGALAPCAAVHTRPSWLGTVAACADESDGSVCVWTHAEGGSSAASPLRLAPRQPANAGGAMRCVALACAEGGGDGSGGGGAKLWCAAASASHAQVWGAVEAA